MIKFIEMSSEDKIALDNQIASVNSVLKKKAEMFGFVSVMLLRKAYKHGEKFDAETKACFNELESLENTVFAVYGKIGNMLASSFFTNSRFDRPHLDECDFVQEANLAIFDAMYLYNGSSKLSTYCYILVKQRMIGFVRMEEIHSRIGMDIKLLRSRVRKIMRIQFCSFETALFILRQTEDISEITEKKVRAACRNVRYIKNEDDNLAAKDVEVLEVSDDVKILLKSLDLVEMSSNQREMIQCFLETGKRPNWVSCGKINPATGKKWTRQALSQNWHVACEKIRFAFEEVAFEAAAA
jgi:DNA-directed RNA polymerase specialized sigma24 family protein